MFSRLGRLLMEPQNNNGAEVRRLHIVYFLSRNGRIEHPHLIRLNCLSGNGVRLRDVKRWLGELRGKDMPESFAWSYKRKYKTGFLWQDLFDDDLITPISDNEYVLKGSEVSTTPNKEQSEAAKDNKESSPANISTKSYSSISEEQESPNFTSSETSTSTEDHPGNIDHTIMKKNSSNTEDTPLINIKHEQNSLVSHSALVSNKNVNKKKNVKRVVISDKIKSSTTASNGNSSNRSSNNILRNLITCGAVETNDSALVMMSKRNHKPFLNMCSGDVRSVHSAEIYKKIEKNCEGSDIVLQTANSRTQNQWNTRKNFHEENDLAKSNGKWKDTSATYRPLNGPKCSLCNKQFKPEKLHAHMKSCKGRKTMFKGSSNHHHPVSAEISKQMSAHEDLGSRSRRHFLAHN